MIALQQPSCRDHVRLLGAYLDGELEQSNVFALESHVSLCAACSEHVQFLRASRVSLKHVVRSTAPSGLRSRIGTAMAAEDVRTQTRTELRETQARSSLGKLGGWRTMVPLASAAALALFWGAANRGPAAYGKQVESGFGGDDLLAELVAEHSQPLPVETTDPRSLEKYVGVPVHPDFERGGATLVGGRVLPMQQQRAAMLQYVVKNGDETRRVSVLVYDPAKIRVNDALLTAHPVGTAQVQVGMARGYTVAVTQRGGVGYAVASDLSQERNAQFAAMAYDDGNQ